MCHYTLVQSRSYDANKGSICFFLTAAGWVATCCGTCSSAGLLCVPSEPSPSPSYSEEKIDVSEKVVLFVILAVGANDKTSKALLKHNAITINDL